MKMKATSWNVMLFFLSTLFCFLVSTGLARAQCDPLAVGPTVDYRLTYDPTTQRFTAWFVPTSTDGHRLVNAQFSIIAPNGYTTPGGNGRDGGFTITNIRGAWSDFVFDNELFTSNNFSALPSLNGLAIHQVGMAKTAVDIPDADVTPGVPVALFSFPATGCTGELRILVNNEPLQVALRNTYGSNANNSISVQIPYQTGNALARERYCKNATENTVTLTLPDLQAQAIAQCVTPGSTYTENFITQVQTGAIIAPGSFSATATEWDSYTVTTSPGISASIVTINQATGQYTLTYPSQPGSLTITNTLRDDCNLASETASVVISWTILGQITVVPTNPASCSGTDGSLALSGVTPGQSYTVSYTLNNGTPVTQILAANGSGVITIPNLSAGDYTNITVSQGNCSTTPQAATLTNPTAPPAPVVTASPSTTVCLGAPLSLSATGSNLQWTGPGGFTSAASSIPVSTTNTGTQIFNVTQTISGCPSLPASVTVVVNPIPTVTLTAASTVCAGSPLSLSATAASGTQPFTYTFNGPNFSTTGSNALVSIANATTANSGSFTVVVSDNNGCTATAEAVVTVVNCVTCVTPLLTVGTPVCNTANNTYSISFVSSGQVSSNVGTVSGNTITGIPAGVNAIITAMDPVAGCSTSMTSQTVVAPSSCDPTNPQYCAPKPTLWAGNAVCEGATYKVSFAVSAGTTITTSTGTVSGSIITGIPVGVNVTLTATSSGTCTSQLIVASPASCTGINDCTPTTASIGGPVCVNGQTYNVPFTLGTGSTLVASTGTNSGSAITGIAVGTPVSITVTNGNCPPRVITITSPTTCVDCVTPLLTVGTPVCNTANNTYSISFVSSGQVSSNVGTVSGNTITGIPAGTNAIITAMDPVAGCSTSMTSQTVVAPSSCDPTNPQYCAPKPTLWAGNAVCEGATYKVSFAVSAGTTITTSTGTVSGSIITGIPVGVNVTLTATSSGTCTSQLIVASPASCTGITDCTPTTASIGGPVCVNGQTYNVPFTLGTGSTLVASTGTNSGSAITGIAVGTPVSITVTNGNCPPRVITITSPATCIDCASLTVTASTSTPVVNSGATISLSAMGSGGQTAYQYRWNGPNAFTSTQQYPFIANAAVSAAGTYTVTLTDFNGCVTTAVVSVTVIPFTEPCALIQREISTVSVDAQCDAATGAASATLLPAPAEPVTYTWMSMATNATVATGASASNLAPGIYVVMAQYSRTTPNGVVTCAYRDTAIISGAQSPKLALTGVTAAACGQPDGSVTLSVTGGAAPYTLNWSGAQSGSTTVSASPVTISGLLAGNYIFTISGNGSTCQGLVMATVPSTAPAQFGLTASATPVTACGLANGTITANWNAVASGPYNLTISGPTTTFTTVTGNSLTLNNQAPGVYQIWVSNNTQVCTSTPVSVTVNTTGATPVSGWSATSGTCASQTGTISFAGGQAATVQYTVRRTGGAVIGNTNGATAASYSVTDGVYEVIRIENGCVSTTSFTIASPAALDATIQSIAAACGGPGSLTVTGIQGGTPGYTVQILNASNVVVTNPASLTAGQYRVVITDAAGCSTSIGAAISVGGTPPTVFATTLATRVCIGQPIFLNASVNNGTQPYTYRWTGPASFTSTAQNPTVANAQATNGGNYTVVVTDATGCSATGVTTIPVAVTACQPPCLARDISVVVINTPCGQNTGKVTATVQPAALPGATVNYQWRNLATNSLISVAQSVTGLTAGAYAVTITVNLNGQTCVYGDTAIVNEIGGPQLAISSIAAAACGQSNGSVTLSLNSGTAPYTVSWTGAQSGSTTVSANTQTISGLAAGSYVFTVTGSGSTCKSVISAQVTTQPGSLGLVGTLVQPQACGVNNGQVTLSWNAVGAGPYRVIFNGVTTTVNSTSIAFTNLAPGTYTAQVTTNTPACASASEIFVLSPTQAPPITGWTVTQPTCANGAALVSFAGGQAGSTQYTVSSINGSQIGTTTGSAPVSYSLTDGIYVLTRVDALTCVTVDTIQIVSPAAIDFNVQIAAGQCGTPGSLTLATVRGGVAPYALQVTNASSQTVSATNLPVGTYTVTVTDANGCLASTTLAVGGGSAVTAVAGISGSSNVCVGNGFALTASASGGTSGTYTYRWAGPNGFTSTQQAPTVLNAQTTASGTYTLTVTDVAGCQATATVSVNVDLANCPCAPRAINLVTVGTECAQANGSATATLVPNPGQNVTIAYSWSALNGAVISSASSVSGLAAGVYVVTATATESNGKQCSYSDTASISPSNAAQVTILGINGADCNQTNGTVTLSINGVGGPYNIAWSGATTGNSTAGSSPTTITGLVTGSYVFTVTQGNNANCAAIAAVTVPINSAAMNLTASVAQSPTNCGLNDGQIVVNWSAVGNGPYQLTVNGVTTTVNTTSQTLTNLAPDTYVIQVSTGNPVCALETITVVLNPVGESPITGWTSVSALCASSNGTIAFAGGQSASTEYILSNADGNIIAVINGAALQNYPLPAGSYKVTRTLGTCVTVLPLTISAPAAIGFNIVRNQPTCALPGSGSLAITNITGGIGSYTTTVTSASGVLTNLTNLSSGSYTVTVTDANGCQVSEVVSLTTGDCGFCFTAKVYLQGSLLNNGDLLGANNEPLMRDDLRALGYLPAATPYGTGVYANFPQVANPVAETITPGLTAITGESAIVDWVFLELRSKTNPAQVLYTRSGLVQRNGTIVDVNGQCLDFNHVAPDSYFVSVRHRNHLGVMTQEPVAFGAGSDVTIDFRTRTPQQIWDKGTSINALYADRERYVVPYATSYYALWGGNANRNSLVAYQGPNEDLTEVYNQVISGPTSFNSPSYILDGYHSGDVDMTGSTIYQGQNDEPTIIFNILILHPSNVFNSPSFENEEQLP